jgi:hypothetical protein
MERDCIGDLLFESARLAAITRTFLWAISFSPYSFHQPIIAIAKKFHLHVGGLFGVFPDALVTGAVLLVLVLGLLWFIA